MRKYINSLICICTLLAATAPVTALQAQRKKVGVVLSGGGAKGVAHIRALRVIEEAGIPIDYIAGTSMGAIIGGLYAIGYTTHELDSMVRTQNWSELLADHVPRRSMGLRQREVQEKYLITVPLDWDKKFRMPSGFLGGQNVYNLFTELTIGYHDSIPFRELPIPFSCVSYDLISGKAVVMDSGYLPRAMRASMSIPGAFEPISENGMVLIDGGISNNFPADVVKDMGAEVIIGIDVTGGRLDEQQLRGLVDIFNQITFFTGEEAYRHNRELVDLRIAPDITGFNAASFSAPAIDSLLVRGETAAKEKFDELIALKQKIGISPGYMPAERKGVDMGKEIKVRKVLFDGLQSYTPERCVKMSGLKPYSVVTTAAIQGAVSQLQGTGLFTRVSYRLEGNEPYDVVFTVRESTRNSAGIGIRFDTEEMAAILINVTASLKRGSNSQVSLTGRLSENPYGRLDFIITNEMRRRLTFSYMFKYNNLDSYHRGQKQSNLDFSQSMGEINYANIRVRNFNVDVGLRYNYYDYRSWLSNRAVRDISRSESLFEYYLSTVFDNFDRPFNPNRGTHLRASYALYTSNLFNYHGDNPFGAVQLDLKGAVPVTRHLTILPGIFGRTIFGDDIPFAARNTLGGTVAGRYMPQQMPFVGLRYFEVFDNSVLGANLDLRWRIGTNEYIIAKANYALHDGKFFDMFSGGNGIFGFGLAYSRPTIAGPIEFLVDWSDWGHKFGVYFGVGYYF